MKYGVYDPATEYGYGSSGFSYIKDGAVIAAASLVGCLYGATAGAIVIATVAAAATYGAVKLAGMLAQDLYVGAKNGSIAGIVGSTIGAGIIGAVGITLTAGMLALATLVTPLLILDGAKNSVQHARANSNAGLLTRIFGGYGKLSEAVNESKMRQFAEIKKWRAGPVQSVD